MKERRVDGRNDLRLYNSILYKHFGDDFPDQSKKYYANEDASQWFDEWGQDTEDCYIANTILLTIVNVKTISHVIIIVLCGMLMFLLSYAECFG